MVEVRVALDTREVKAALKALRTEGPKAVADALNRTAFEVLDAEAIEVRGAFPFASQSTAQFLARSFVFDKATPDRLSIRVKPKNNAPGFLAEHAFGDTIKPDGERLTFAGKLAVPVGAKRGARGRVKSSDLPGAILSRGGFSTPRAIFLRSKGTGRKRGPRNKSLRQARLMYLLLERPVRLAKSLHFFEVFDRTVRREFPKKANRVLEKINLRRGR